MFDAAWQKATGTIPRWLQLTPAQDWLVIAWWNASSWKPAKVR